MEILTREEIRQLKGGIQKRKRFSKFIVVLCILTLWSYAVAVLYFTYLGFYVPDSLTYTFVPAFTLELGALAGIEIKDAIAEKKIEKQEKYHDIV